MQSCCRFIISLAYNTKLIFLLVYENFGVQIKFIRIIKTILWRCVDETKLNFLRIPFVCVLCLCVNKAPLNDLNISLSYIFKVRRLINSN
jgi:hypothetical protein